MQRDLSAYRHIAAQHPGGGVIHTGDAIEVMRGMEAESVDAVCTDPPYGIEFMGRDWDSSHRLWAATGTPHVGRVNGQGGMDTWPTRPRYSAGFAFQAWCEVWGREALRVTKPGGYLLAFGGTRTHHRLVCGLEDAGWIIRDELDWIYASGFPKGKANLKPAHEPIVLARKPGPLRPLAIDECRIGYSSDADYEAADYEAAAAFQELRKGHPGGSPVIGMTAPPAESTQNTVGRWPSNLLLSDPELFDQPNPWVVGSGATSDSGEPHQVRRRATSLYEGGWASTDEGFAMGGAGGYSRFFIIPKADRGDREPVLRGETVDYEHSGPRGHTLNGDGTPRRPSLPRVNVHATVKPTDLMRHLVRLVTPSGGTVLDPFLGSGSTAIACELEGFPWIGIEQDASYVAIAEARLNGTQRGLGLDVGAPTSTRKGRARPDSQIPEWPHEGWKESSAQVFRGYTSDEEPAA